MIDETAPPSWGGVWDRGKSGSDHSKNAIQKITGQVHYSILPFYGPVVSPYGI